MSVALDARAAGVRLLVLDVDGVLTDGSIYLDDAGRETKRFNVRDGAGIKAWRGLGGKVGVITGRSGQALQHRLAELGVGELAHGVGDKVLALRDLCARTGVSPAQTAYIGDDWPDLYAMRSVGYAIAVGDADNSVKQAAAFVTTRMGGQGAVREAIEHLLRARGDLDRAIELVAWGKDPGGDAPSL